MRITPCIIAIALLAACQQVPDADMNNPNKRVANIDDHAISVVPEVGGVYAAWGGDEDKDGFVQYRQKRAIELISGCRIARVLSGKTEAVLRAKVKC
jgi:hypothetical protein